MSDDFIKENSTNLTIDHIKKGPEGYADFIVNNPLKNRIICTDLSRRKIKYKNEDGNVVSDPNFLNLSKKIFPNMNEINIKLINEYSKQLEDIYPNLEDRFLVMKQILDYQYFISEGYTDDTKDIYNDLVKNICLKSLPSNNDDNNKF